MTDHVVAMARECRNGRLVCAGREVPCDPDCWSHLRGPSSGSVSFRRPNGASQPLRSDLIMVLAV